MRYPLHLIGLLLVAPALLAGCGLKKKAEPPAPPAPAPTIPSVSIDTTQASGRQQENYTLAKTKAAEWQSDAVLYHLQVKLGSSIDLSGGTETYTFGSGKDRANWWTIAISQRSGKFIRAIIPKEDYLGADLSPAKTEFWKTSYGDALLAAEQNGGSSFRESSGLSEVTITLSNGQPNGWLWWMVEYKGSTGETFKVRIEPSSGTLYDEQGNPLSAGSSQ